MVDTIPTTSFMFRAVTTLASTLLDQMDNKTEAVAYCIHKALEKLDLTEDDFSILELHKAIQPLSPKEEEEILVKELLQDIRKARETIADKRRNIAASQVMIRLALGRLNTNKALLCQLDYKGII